MSKIQQKTAKRISRDFHWYLNKTKYCPGGCSVVKFIEQKRTNEFINMTSKINKKIWDENLWQLAKVSCHYEIAY